MTWGSKCLSHRWWSRSSILGTLQGEEPQEALTCLITAMTALAYWSMRDIGRVRALLHAVADELEEDRTRLAR